MGRSAKPRKPAGASTQGQCSGHEQCNKGGCSHPKPWWSKLSRPGAKYNKKKRNINRAKKARKVQVAVARMKKALNPPTFEGTIRG